MNRFNTAISAFAPLLLLSGCGGNDTASDPSSQATGQTAQQPQGVGSVTGTIGGEPVNLYVLGSQSDYTNVSLSIYALGNDLTDRGFRTFRVGAEWIGSMDGGFTSTEATIDIPDTNPARVYHGDKDSGLVLTVTDSSESGDTLTISGTIKGTLTKMDLAGGRNADPADTQDVDLAIEASLSKL